MVEHKQVEHAKPLKRRDQSAVKGREAAVDEHTQNLDLMEGCEHDGSYIPVTEVHRLMNAVRAAEREAWQKEYDKKFAEWTAAINRLNELAGEHRVTLAALDAAEEIIDHVQTRYEGQVVRGNMLEKMREHQFQRADKAEATVAMLTRLNSAQANTIGKAEARVKELEKLVRDLR